MFWRAALAMISASLRFCLSPPSGVTPCAPASIEPRRSVAEKPWGAARRGRGHGSGRRSRDHRQCPASRNHPARLLCVNKAFSIPVLYIVTMLKGSDRLSKKGFFRSFNHGNFTMILSNDKEFSAMLYGNWREFPRIFFGK
jgi:hypothetical protein